MAAVESAETTKDGFRLKLDDGSVLDAGKAYLPPEYPGVFLCQAADLAPEAEAALRFAAECLAAEKAALHLIARAEQFAAGLTVKLEQRGHGSLPVRAVLDRLAALDLINDERYARLWLKYRITRGVNGPRVLAAKLRAKGIDRKTTDAALNTALTADAEAALLQRRVAKAGFTDGGGRNGGLRCFLRTEGFSPAVIDGYFGEM